MTEVFVHFHLPGCPPGVCLAVLQGLGMYKWWAGTGETCPVRSLSVSSTAIYILTAPFQQLEKKTKHAMGVFQWSAILAS